VTSLPEREPGRGRRRRRRRGRQRGLHLLPHLFTTANLFFGFFAIVQATAGRFDQAALGIVLSGIADVLDGRVARLTRSTSRFGVEYDSLADVVSFGVAPALLAFHAGNLHVLGRTGWVMAFVFTVGAALRLARFNVEPARLPGRFEGLPSPAAAGTVAATQWFVSFLREQGIGISVPESAVAAGVALLGLLMVSAVPYRSFKQIDWRHSFRTLVLVVLALVVVVQEPRLFLFLVALCYLVSGPVEWAWRRVSGRPLERVTEVLSSEGSQGSMP
jgi:CDP-diacylglycerol--serine O-phosphatidyltransferase